VIVPKGQFHELTGTLWRSSIPPWHLYEIHTDGGGRWFLDTPRRVDNLIGQSVHVEGVRWEFSIIDVKRIWPVGAPRPLNWRERLARFVRRGRR
jgi:hypothetical protein